MEGKEGKDQNLIANRHDTLHPDTHQCSNRECMFQSRNREAFDFRTPLARDAPVRS